MTSSPATRLVLLLPASFVLISHGIVIVIFIIVASCNKNLKKNK